MTFGVLSKLSIAATPAPQSVKKLFFKLLDVDTVAAAGTDQTDATPLTAGKNVVTAADGTVGVILPVGVEGMSVEIVNTVSNQDLKVYPNTGAQINALTATTGAFTVVAAAGRTFHCDAPLHWYVSAGNLTGTATTSSTAELNYNDIAVLGTGAASKAVVLDAGEDYTWPATGVLTYGVLKDPAATTLGATAAELNYAADLSANTQTITGAGAQTVAAATKYLQLDNAAATIAATIANGNTHQGLFTVKAITEPAGGQDHTVTLTAGTWNGTNTIATFADINDTLVVVFDSAGNGTVVVNVGTVSLTGP